MERRRKPSPASPILWAGSHAKGEHHPVQNTALKRWWALRSSSSTHRRPRTNGPAAQFILHSTRRRARSSKSFAMVSSRKGVWSAEEHDRFLDAITEYPQGPWIAIAKFVGTRSARQVQTHAQKYYEKIARHLRGLQRDRKPAGGKEHRLEERILSLLGKASDRDARDQLAKAPRRSRHAVSPQQEPSTVDGTNTPPCLQRIQELPSSPVSVDAVATISSPSTTTVLTVSCGVADESADTSSLPSLEQSLDFFIDFLSDPMESLAASEPSFCRLHFEFGVDSFNNTTDSTFV